MVRTNTAGQLDDSDRPQDKGESIGTVNDFRFSDRFQDENRDPNHKADNASQYSTNATARKEELCQPLLLSLKPEHPLLQSRLPKQSAVGLSPSPIRSAVKSELNFSSSVFLPNPSPTFSIEGVSIEQINNERQINRELLKVAKNYLEVAKLIKAAVQGVVKRVPGANLLTAQAQSKCPRHLEEVKQSKLKLQENYSVCF